MTSQRIDFLGLPLDTDVDGDAVCRLLQQPGEARLVSFINPAAWAVAKKDPGYTDLLKQMSFVLPDGEGVARGCRLLTDQPCPRVSFDMSSLADPFFKTMQANNQTLGVVGAAPMVAEHFEDKLAKAYPALKVTASSHGFGDFAPKIALIMNAKPDVVLVGMGASRQEAFLIALRDSGFKDIGITCGGFLDQYLVEEKYYPGWIDRMNLRFAYRFYKEPGRLWHRYLLDYQVYIGRLTEALALKHRAKAEMAVRKRLSLLEEKRPGN